MTPSSSVPQEKRAYPLPAKFIAIVDNIEYEMPNFQKFSSKFLDGNFYVDAVLLSYCPSDHVQEQHMGDDCSETLRYDGSTNLLKSVDVNILSTGTYTLNPLLYIRHSGGVPIGTVFRERVDFESSGLIVEDAFRIRVSVPASRGPMASSSPVSSSPVSYKPLDEFVLVEGFSEHGRNELFVDLNIPSGKALDDNRLQTSFFQQGSGSAHFLTDYNRDKSSVGTGLYAYDFEVSSNHNGNKLVFRTFLMLLDDDGNPIQLEYKRQRGHACCI